MEETQTITGPEDGVGLEARIKKEQRKGWAVTHVLWEDLTPDDGMGQRWKAHFKRTKTPEKPLLIFTPTEYAHDPITIYANTEGLQLLKALIEQTLKYQTTPSPFITVYQGQKESHEIKIVISTHEDHPSEYDPSHS